jgi:SPP1 gp7 family putative phage head morphogenesis protein
MTTDAELEKRVKELEGEINTRAYGDSRAIEKAFGKHMGEMEDILSRAAGEGYTLGDKVAQTELGIGLSFHLVKEETVGYMAAYRGSLREGGTTIKGEWVPWLQDYEVRTRNQVWKTIDEGIKEGKSYTKIAKDLEGVMERSRADALRIARTEVSRAQIEGTLARMRDAGVTRVQWLLGPTPCEICDGYGGEEYDIDDLPEEIPVHPNCACGLRAIIDPYADYTEEAESILDDARSLEPYTTSDLRGIAEEIGGDLDDVKYVDPKSGRVIYALDNKIKELESLKKELGRKYVDKILDPSTKTIPTIGDVGKEVTDSLRYTITLEPENYAAGSQSAIDKMVNSGYTLVKETNLWDNPAPGGQKGIVAIFKLKEEVGPMVEVQFHTQASYEAMALGLSLDAPTPTMATLVKPGFDVASTVIKPATTILAPPTEPQAALAWANDHGVVYIELDKKTFIGGDVLTKPQPMPPRMVNEINRVVADYRAADYSEEFDIVNATIDKHPGFYRVSSEEIYLDAARVIRNETNRDYQTYKIANGGVSFTVGDGKVEATIRHESAHQLFYTLEEVDPDSINRIKTIYQEDMINKQLVRHQISNYAIENSHEYFSEYWTKITMSDYTPGTTKREQDLIKIVNDTLGTTFKAHGT